MLGSILLGLVAAVVASIPPALHEGFRGIAWSAPIPVLGVAAAAMLIQHFILDRRSGYRGYDGLADLFVDVHTPGASDSTLRWTLRGFVSLLLSVFGGSAGSEGAAIEFSQAMATAARGRTARWFEQRRRTDAGSTLAAGFAAAFWAPFAALLLPVELGIGGRTSSVALSALTAYLASRGIASLTGARPYDFGGVLAGFHIDGAVQIEILAGIAIVAGALGAGLVRFIRFFQESLLELFQTQTWMRTLAGGVLLCLVTLVHTAGHQPGAVLFEHALWGQGEAQEIGLLIATQILILSAVISGFGTIGIFWPLLALGSLIGFEGFRIVSHAGPASFGIATALIGGAALWSSVIGTPLTAAVAAYELGSNPEVILPCFLAGLLARQVRVWLRTPAVYDKDLEARGLSLVDGKAVRVLDALRVRDAMVSDHESVRDQAPLSELHAVMLKSRYPFLPVVNAEGVYQGLLTVDMVQEAYQAQAHRLLEAKDLLIRAKSRVTTVLASDKLTAGVGIFGTSPCVAVVNETGRVAGLLFAYSVRLAYDREVARRSLVFESTDVSP
jgi:CIC family chloride channel protein